MTRQNQLIIAVVAILIILLGLGGYFVLGRNQTPTSSKTANTNQPAASNTGKNVVQSSITDLFASGATKQCAFDVKGASGSETKGVVYVAGDKAYGDFDMNANGKTTATYLIRNGTTFYMWGDALPSGIKMTMNVSDMATKMQGGQYSTFNPSSKVSYNCSAWSVDESKFTPPSNVKFIDAAAMMPKTTGTTTQPQTGSDPCAQIADVTTKAACENAMHH